MKILQHALRRLALVLVVTVGITACADQGPTEPATPRPALSQTTGAVLLECPINVTRSVESTIDILGGTVSLDGHSITLPFGAVTLPTTIKLTVPASNYVEVDITANGLEHFQFEKAATVVISYARCTRSNIANKTISAWYFDGATKTLISPMASTDDRANSRVLFSTDHLSEYSAATN